MKTVFSLILLISGSFMAGAQGFQDRYFSAWGISPILDFGTAPGRVVYPAVRSDAPDTLYFIYQNDYLTLISLSYEGRYNLYTSGDNLAISVKGKPTLNINVLNGMGGFYIPFGVGLEVGNGATYQTSSKMGFTLTGGYSLNVFPLIKAGDIQEKATHYRDVNVNTFWSSPYVALGIRYWNNQNKLREINILYGFGGSNDEIPSDIMQKGFDGETNIENLKFRKSFMLCVSWMIYLNY